MEEYSFTTKQREAFDKMIQGRNLFLTGQAGVGKSFLLQSFIHYYRRYLEKENEKIYVTSTTGISSLIIGGQTIYRYCGIGTGDKDIETYVKSIVKNRKTRNRYIETKVLIIDEISMMKPELFDKIDLIFRKIRRDTRPFGGVQIIISGDLLQLPPVCSDEFIFESFNWDDVIDETIYLDEVMRQNDNIFIQVLNKVRLGIVDDEVRNLLESRRNIEPTNEFGLLPSKLYSKRDKVNRINVGELQKLIEEGETTKIFHSRFEYGKSVKEESKNILQTLIQDMTDIEDEITLTTKCQVILKVNIPELRLANGSRGIILGFSPDTGFPIVQFLDGRYMEIAPHTWEFEDNKESIKKIQIPLQLAFALSFHKSQGSTLEYVIIDIGRDVFEYGQTYVALSRVKSLEGLFIENTIDYTKIRANPKVLRFYESISSC